MVETPEPSDQQPEEGPAEQVDEDKEDPGKAVSQQGGGNQAERVDSASRDADGQATGDPKSAG